ncbi:MAG: hypothetical protein ACRD3D_11270 [Terriglobia bacterium]
MADCIQDKLALRVIDPEQNAVVASAELLQASKLLRKVAERPENFTMRRSPAYAAINLLLDGLTELLEFPRERFRSLNLIGFEHD